MKRTLAILILSALFAMPVFAQDFTEVAGDVGITIAGMTGVPSWFDYDNDGDLDFLRSCRFGGAVRLYRNNDGQFAVLNGIGLPSGSDVQNAQPIDFDRDGDIDIFFVGYNDDFRLMVNEDGHYTDRAEELGLQTRNTTREFSWVDFNHDGYLDVLIEFTNEWKIYQSVEGQSFVDVTDESGLPQTCDNTRFALGDYDLDGEMDIYMMRYHAPDRLYHNTGSGIFEDVTAASGLQTAGNCGCTWADFNNDKYPDLLTPGPDYHTIWLNDGDGTFTEMNVHGTAFDFEEDVGFPHGARYAVADYDMDGDLDVFAVLPGGTGYNLGATQFFRQDSQNGLDIWFTDIVNENDMYAPLDGFPRWVDYDADGDMDLTVLLDGQAPLLYRNNRALTGSRLEVRVLGPDGCEDRWHRRVEAYIHDTDQIARASFLGDEHAGLSALNNYLVLDENIGYDIHVYLTDGRHLSPETNPELSNVVPSAIGNLLTVYTETQTASAELTSLTAEAGDATATIRWTTASESYLAEFVIARDGADVLHIAAANAPHSYEWMNAGLTNGTTYEYVLTAVGLDGSEIELGSVSATPTSLSGVNPGVPAAFAFDAYPNPFNASTTLQFSIPVAGSGLLKIFTVAGRQIREIPLGSLNAGTHEYHWNATDLSSGVYLVQLSAGQFSDLKKVVLLK